MSALGFAEAFMYGDVECDDLVTLFKVCSRFLMTLGSTCLLMECLDIHTQPSES